MSGRVAIHGSYFANNYGDTLLVKLMCDQVSQYVGKENVYLAVEGDEDEQKYIGYPVLDKNDREGIEFLIFAGGGYFGEPQSSSVKKAKWALRNYKRHISWVNEFKRAKIGVYGVGFGPLSSNLFRYFLQKRVFGRAETVFFSRY
ncbi:polysaccharide pyruvyl transferase family protein [Halomonas sp. BC04]|uniref:polysaccharide pyruvyl transferase family protein n=1 Tax=Halomonas sp. BC04 TaxID=1403540 RepID=UPI0012DFD2E9|nr:polysaccharide pyruvyl transferase family protein [Halomonas sp. BC04]